MTNRRIGNVVAWTAALDVSAETRRELRACSKAVLSEVKRVQLSAPVSSSASASARVEPKR